MCPTYSFNVVSEWLQLQYFDMEYQKLLDTAMKVGLEISPEKTVCIHVLSP